MFRDGKILRQISTGFGHEINDHKLKTYQIYSHFCKFGSILVHFSYTFKGEMQTKLLHFKCVSKDYKNNSKIYILKTMLS